MVGGLAGICVGAYAVLDASTPRYLAAPLLLAGLCVGVAGVAVSGRGVHRSSYRPDHWLPAELVTAASGLAAGVLLSLSARVDPTDLYPSLTPLTWPQLSLLPVLAVLLGLVPAVWTPPAAPMEAAAP